MEIIRIIGVAFNRVTKGAAVIEVRADAVFLFVGDNEMGFGGAAGTNRVLIIAIALVQGGGVVFLPGKKFRVVNNPVFNHFARPERYCGRPWFAINLDQ